MTAEERKEISFNRAEELRLKTQDYLKAREHIKIGLNMGQEISVRKEKVKKILGASEEQWNSWEWQMSNRINKIETLCQIINLDSEQKADIDSVGKTYMWSVSPYYAALMDENDPQCPIRLIALPLIDELNDILGSMDPMHEELTNPAGTITRRYPDRLIINVTSECGSYCRFCQRRRNIGCNFGMAAQREIDESVEYIKENEEIRDVLVTGGDPLTLSDSELECILSKLRAITHVEIIRIGTRVPATLPMRVTDELCHMLKKYHPLYINTHFNHPMEICEGSSRAVQKLADAGIPLGNQMVLLNGINNDKDVVKCLNHELLKVRIRPYYIFHPKAVKGTSHFKCSIDEGIDIMEHLRGYTSGLAIPYYIINAPGGLGKVPILPEYLISKGKGYFEIRTWEGVIIRCDD